ncbi:hypothetical protein V501_00426 [Pseudogymnoascus sp. VKM F-4519 (FW-2642)]|nr:hypothetical protein V501_00426 [Pseudogymnoascus sp. VKM F-4519 (FW-2642)]
MANTQVEIKGGYSPAMVPFLNGADDWLDFSDGIKTFLIMGNQLDWLEDHRNTPVNPSVEWKKKHKFAIYAMRARSNYNAKATSDSTIPARPRILLDDNGGEVDFDFVALKAKGYERTLAQEESVTALTASTVLTTIRTTSIALTATGDTKNIEAKAGKGRYGPSSKKRKTREDDDKSDDPIGLIAHFGMTANNDTGNLLHT